MKLASVLFPGSIHAGCLATEEIDESLVSSRVLEESPEQCQEEVVAFVSRINSAEILQEDKESALESIEIYKKNCHEPCLVAHAIKGKILDMQGYQQMPICASGNRGQQRDSSNKQQEALQKK